jgi:hypothetical protein
MTDRKHRGAVGSPVSLAALLPTMHGSRVVAAGGGKHGRRDCFRSRAGVLARSMHTPSEFSHV